MKRHIFGIAAAAALVAVAASQAAAQQAEQPIKYTVEMKASSATPPVDGKGSGRATLSFAGHTLRFNVNVKDLSGPATMAHIHVGQVGVSGPPVYTFEIKKVASGNLARGSIDLSAKPAKGISGDSLMVLLNNGSAYINVHTAAHPGGEIRGQIVKE
jgi:Cu/Zn superoxide dismutase